MGGMGCAGRGGAMMCYRVLKTQIFTPSPPHSHFPTHMHSPASPLLPLTPPRITPPLHTRRRGGRDHIWLTATDEGACMVWKQVGVGVGGGVGGGATSKTITNYNDGAGLGWAGYPVHKVIRSLALPSRPVRSPHNPSPLD